MSLVEGYSSSSENEDKNEPQDKSSKQLSSGAFSDEVSVIVSDVYSERATCKRNREKDSLSRERKRFLRKRSPWDPWSQDESESATESEIEREDERSAEWVNASGGEFRGYKEQEEVDDIYASTTETSKFYGESEKNYLGRGFLHPPIEVDLDFNKAPMSFKCFLPKKIIHTFPGHSQGTNTLQFLPNTGHLFLSGGNDNTIKIWDFYHERKCLRDYKGHSRPVKAVDFTKDGMLFLSASFDQHVKLWDTESGNVVSRLKFNSTPNDIKTHPLKPNEFIVGCSNSKIYHYDTRVAERQGNVQIYDHHLSSILHLCYFPDGSKFISSSEDKTVRIWENQINIPIKQISDTAQHSMPYIDIHPAGRYFCSQSMDNTIYTYSMKPKYKKHPKKSFTGHMSAGYGIGLTFSPDGRYICSGDSKSRIVIWDWTTTNLLKKLKVPGNDPITQIAWNPQETSKLICGGPAGKIYLWD